mmetsp:Transcript_13882/g.29073  ORF Transcript_13882/g.29073 Transcript_13882/m.29073 type:complete len:131 (-) Transcript_13882:1053-1445(-)
MKTNDVMKPTKLKRIAIIYNFITCSFFLFLVPIRVDSIAHTYFPSHQMATFRPSKGNSSITNRGSFRRRYVQNCSCVRTETNFGDVPSPESSINILLIGKKLGKTQQGTTTKGLLYFKAASTIASVAPSA